MARPQTVTDGEIHAGARAVFVREGPQASVMSIAKHVGISAPALLERVGTKNQLLLAALKPTGAKAMTVFAGAPPATGAERHLRRGLLRLMAFLRDLMPNLVVLRAAGHDFSASIPANELPPTVAIRRALAAWLRRTREWGLFSARRARGVAEGLLGAMEARCFNGYVGGARFSSGSDEGFIRMLVHGLLGVAR